MVNIVKFNPQIKSCFLNVHSLLVKSDQATLFLSGSEWPFDQAQPRMHSRYARNLYDPKMKRIFEIAWALFEIILFIRIKIAWTGPDKSEIFWGI